LIACKYLKLRGDDMNLANLKIIQSNNNYNQMAWIEDIVRGLTDLYKLRSPYLLCKHLGISIIRLEPSSPILNGTSSRYFRNYEGDEAIFIKNDLYGYDEERILRHQLGHAILHTNIHDSLYPHSCEVDNESNYFSTLLKEIKIDIRR